MSCVFQNLAGLQNRYPDNQWQEIIGNCDAQIFLGCTDELTAKFISDRSGEASINVSSKSRMLGTYRISDYTPEYRETSGIGRRKLLTMDEVLRIPIDKALVIIRGQKVLQVDKYDYSLHPESKKLIPCKASEYIPVRPVSESTPGSQITLPDKTVSENTEESQITLPDKAVSNTRRKDNPPKSENGKPGGKPRYASSDKDSIIPNK
jgi:type IV secretion system protein VirD4